jgi:ribosomal protein L11 methyltransferase
MAAPIAWIEVLVSAPEGWGELVAEALALGPCTSVAFGAPSLGTEPASAGWEYVRTYFPETEDSPALRARIEGELAALAERTGAAELAGVGIRFRRLPPEDFASSWRKAWKPFRVGRLAVIPPEVRRAPRASDVRLALEPGGAFGTGRHPTTRACLRFLQAEPLEGARVLDAGCGSGILGVAAVLLGARSAAGFDIDPHAIPYALALASQNGVAERCRFLAGGFECLASLGPPFDVVVANLYADLIEEHARALAGALRSGGRFAVSGVLSEKRSSVVAALEAARLRVEAIAERGRWDAYAGRSG